MKKTIRKMLASDPSISSKRVIGAVTVIIIHIIALVNLFTGKVVTDYVFEGLIWLAIGCIFGISSERFAEVLSSKSRGGEYYPPVGTPITPTDPTNEQ